MKVQITFKDPDSLHEQLHNQISDQEKYEEVSDLCSKWFKYSEYLSVEIDTEAETCTVVENK